MRIITLFIVFLGTQLMAKAQPGLQATTSSTPTTAAALATPSEVAPCGELTDKAPPGAHTVRLSWNASVPASTAAADAVIGYIVYRSTKANDANSLPINLRQISDTACLDVHVSPGADYYYVIRAVSAKGISGPSNEVRVHIPAEPSRPGE